jgi:hypothetical protein
VTEPAFEKKIFDCDCQFFGREMISLRKIKMKKTLLILSVAVVCAVNAIAQTGDIMMKKGGKFEADGRTLKPREVLTLMESNEQAHAAFKKAKSNYDAGQTFGFIGGLLVGWPLGTAIAGGDPQWGLAAAGGALILASIPFQAAFKKNARAAVALYNAQSGALRYRKPTYHVAFYGTGVNVSMRF